jgi:phosphomannomutase
MEPYRVAVFDLDGTLAASKSDISPATAHMLCALLSAIDVCIISGGGFEQFDAQVLRHLNTLCALERLHLMPTCGTRYLRWDGGAWIEMYFEKLSSGEKNRACQVLRNGAEKLGLNRSEFDAASFFEKDADYVEALPGRAA